jgi:hypothetical protein
MEKSGVCAEFDFETVGGFVADVAEDDFAASF